MKKVILIITIILSAIVISPVVNSTTDMGIVGRWRPYGTNDVVTFHQNGDMSYGEVKGRYQYNGKRLIMDLKRGEKYRSITSVGAYTDENRLYLAYAGKGYLIGSKNNDGLLGKWESYRYFKLINSHTGYPYEERLEHLILNFWEGTVQITQGYDTHEEITDQFSYDIAYDETVDRNYFYSREYPEDRTYYEIVDLGEEKLLLLSHKYKLSGSKTVSVTFNYPFYERLPQE